MKFRKISHLKYMGKKGVTECLKTPSELLQKNLKKFMVIFYMNIHLHEFFQIFLSNRVLWRKSFLIVCLSPYYLNGKNEVSGASTSRPNWTLSPWNIFYNFFGNDFQREKEKKMNLGNKERLNV